jgi:hypothetical protein
MLFSRGTISLGLPAASNCSAEARTAAQEAFSSGEESKKSQASRSDTPACRMAAEISGRVEAPRGSVSGGVVC